MAAPYASQSSTQLPSGLTRTVQRNKTVCVATEWNNRPGYWFAERLNATSDELGMARRLSKLQSGSGRIV